jgi:hypothetical protein
MSHTQKSTKIFVSHSVTRFLCERSPGSHSKFAQIWVKKGGKNEKKFVSHTCPRVSYERSGSYALSHPKWPYELNVILQ